MHSTQLRALAIRVLDRDDPTRTEIEQLAMAVAFDAGDFYERDFYPFSNFSAFKVYWKGIMFDTSEHVYHWEKYNTDNPKAVHIQSLIRSVGSAHDAFVLASANDLKLFRRSDWDDIKGNGRPLKVNIMAQIIEAKWHQHEYVKKKLKQAYDKGIRLSERSWRDDFWGIGPNGDGADWMGVLWNELAAKVYGS